MTCSAESAAELNCKITRFVYIQNWELGGESRSWKRPHHSELETSDEVQSWLEFNRFPICFAHKFQISRKTTRSNSKLVGFSDITRLKTAGAELSGSTSWFGLPIRNVLTNAEFVNSVDVVQIIRIMLSEKRLLLMRKSVFTKLLLPGLRNSRNLSSKIKVPTRIFCFTWSAGTRAIYPVPSGGVFSPPPPLPSPIDPDQ